jgi:hypothetical protein
VTTVIANTLEQESAPTLSGRFPVTGNQPLIQRACVWGGEGTPEVSEYCAAELGALHGTGILAARTLIADALDLRDRLPRLWNRVLAGGVRAWQARQIAEHTRPFDCSTRLARIARIALDRDPLSWEACADVFSFDSEDGLKNHRRQGR